MAENEHDSNVAFTPVLRLKDVEYALQLARSLGIGTPFGDVARDAFARLCQLGREKANESAVMEVAREPSLPAL
jgi:3-hydroxyisobutyrate dehydrogenase-like beta-hydroxyacid dehydrogenase